MRARRLLWLVIGLLPFAMFAPLSHRLGAVDTLSEQAVALRRDEVEAAELWAAGALAVRQEQLDQAAPQPSACWYEGAVSFSGRPSAGAVREKYSRICQMCKSKKAGRKPLPCRRQRLADCGRRRPARSKR